METYIVTVIIIIFLHGLGRLTCSGIDALPYFPGASTVSFFVPGRLSFDPLISEAVRLCL